MFETGGRVSCVLVRSVKRPRNCRSRGPALTSTPTARALRSEVDKGAYPDRGMYAPRASSLGALIGGRPRGIGLGIRGRALARVS